jgi:hypothetical protein
MIYVVDRSGHGQRSQKIALPLDTRIETHAQAHVPPANEERPLFAEVRVHAELIEERPELQLGTSPYGELKLSVQLHHERNTWTARERIPSVRVCGRLKRPHDHVILGESESRGIHRRVRNDCFALKKRIDYVPNDVRAELRSPGDL